MHLNYLILARNAKLLKTPYQSPMAPMALDCRSAEVNSVRFVTCSHNTVLRGREELDQSSMLDDVRRGRRKVDRRFRERLALYNGRAARALTYSATLAWKIRGRRRYRVVLGVVYG